MKHLLSILVGLILSTSAWAQSDFYAVDSLREIRIYFEESNWDEILDSLYVDGKKERLTGRIEIDGQRYDSVGIRYKGFSSVSVNRVKNPFNIKLDHVIEDQEHNGVNKLKVSNVIQDPSFVREVLSYEIARKYMPASEANFTNVYVNDTLFGLYTNVEAVNKDFIAKHYSSRNNTFFKCNPEHLDLNGENSNLSMSPGKDTSKYYPYYDIESDYGWAELLNLIDTLNNFTDEIETILDVDRTLWMHAFNYALVNFDSYIGYAQNYYLYRGNDGRFNPIIWDLNMSFGSFRFTDASNYYQGFTVNEAPYMDPLTHLNSVSVYPRPLLRKLLENERYKKMFMAHLRTIMEENIATGEYYQRAEHFQNLIRSHVQADTNKFYTDSDFELNIDSTVKDLIEYPGIKDLMEKRLDYLREIEGYGGAPAVASVQHENGVIPGNDLWVSSTVRNAQRVFLAYRFGRQNPFVKIEMKDDGTGKDQIAADGIFGASIPQIGNLVQYYIYAENDSAGVFNPARAAYEFYEIQFNLQAGDLVINELAANNTRGAIDEYGNYSDWIELYNTSSNVISTAGLYMSDDASQPTKWAMPDRTVAPDEYLIVWANGVGNNGLNANFRLSAQGEQVYLSNIDQTVLDTVSFGKQESNASFARSPNGTGDFVAKFPSFGFNNDSAKPYSQFEVSEFVLYPNPSDNIFSVHLESDKNSVIQVIDMNGHLLAEETMLAEESVHTFNTSNLMNGVYLVRVINNGYAATKKLIKI